MLNRIISDILLSAIVLFYPGYFFILAGSVSVFTTENYWEFIVLSVIVDLVYGIPAEAMSGFRFVFFFVAIIIAGLIYFVKEKLRT